MSNLDSLAALFDDELRSRLDELAADFARNRSDRDAADRLALHCMRLLLVPKQGNYPGMKACQGLVYPPGSSGKPVSVSFDVASKLDDNARVCLLYDLFRKDQYHRLKVRETVPRPTPPQPQPRTPAREFE